MLSSIDQCCPVAFGHFPIIAIKLTNSWLSGFGTRAKTDNQRAGSPPEAQHTGSHPWPQQVLWLYQPLFNWPKQQWSNIWQALLLHRHQLSQDGAWANYVDESPQEELGGRANSQVSIMMFVISMLMYDYGDSHDDHVDNQLNLNSWMMTWVDSGHQIIVLIQCLKACN